MGLTNIKLIVFTCIVNLLAFATSNAYSWSSTVLVSLKSDDPSRNPLGRPITLSEESWITSLISLGALLGPLVSGFFAEKLGRKKTLLMFAVPMLVSHIILAYATTPIEFFIARFMVGVGAGAVYTVVPMYIGEIAETAIRGLLGCMIIIFACLGHLFVYLVGPFVHLQTFSFILMVPILLCIFLFSLFVPESPYYYIAIGDEMAARQSLTKLRKNSYIHEELVDIKLNVEEAQCGKKSMSTIWKSKSFKKGIIITSLLMILQQSSGITVILSYMQSIFIASGSSLSLSLSSILVTSIQTITVVISSYLSDKWGRKSLLIIATSGCALPLFSLGIYFTMKNAAHDVSLFWWVPISSLIIYIIFFNFGFSAVPWALLGELFSNKTKSLASTITSFMCYFTAFVMTFIFPKIQEVLGMEGAFFMFLTSSLAALFFVVWYVPETKGKTFQEILRILEK